MKRSLIQALVCILVIAAGSVPSRSSFALPEAQAAQRSPCVAARGSSSLAIASFNVQWIGQSAKRDDPHLAEVLQDCDIVVIQELIAPPYKGTFPDGTPFEPDPQATEFFDAMSQYGFKYELSSEDTGSGATNHLNSPATEWWVVFYKAKKVIPAGGLPTEFLDADRTDNKDYERVPYAFAFRTPEGHLDFVLISVHLQPGGGTKDKARRKVELSAINAWVQSHENKEKDFIILGDMNIENAAELKATTPAGFLSLNDQCETTNTNVNGPKPYDHIMYRPEYTKEIDQQFDFQVLNLIEAMRPFWTSTDIPYPGGAANQKDLPKYNHDAFRAYYSDHDPVFFKLNIPAKDDD